MAPRPVFSVLLASFPSVPITGTGFGPPPAGDTWVIRDIAVVNTGPWFRALGGILFQDLDGTVFFNVSGPQAWAGNTVLWEGRQVIPPGGRVSVIPQEVGWSVRVSGYQLTAT